MLALLVLLLTSDAGARWRVEPAQVEVGQPFELVLELEHPPGTTLATLAPGELTLDPSWTVLASGTSSSAEGGAGLLSTRTWRVASLEAGERSLAEALATFPFGEGVTRIQVGDARVTVTSVLAEGEDAPRALTGFAGELGPAPAREGLPRAVLLCLVPLLLGPLVFLWLRRRRLSVAPVRVASSAELLAEIVARAAAGAGRDACYDLTRLLRQHTDRVQGTDRAALTDEEWLAELERSPQVPAAAVGELCGVFARTARVKYAGEQPSPWALEELFGQARRALAALAPGEAQP